MQTRMLTVPILLALAAGCTESPEADATESTVVQKGKASYYARSFQGKETASGETFNQNELVAAHKTLPFDTRVEVTNLENGKQVTVRINDIHSNHNIVQMKSVELNLWWSCQFVSNCLQLFGCQAAFGL